MLDIEQAILTTTNIRKGDCWNSFLSQNPSWITLGMIVTQNKSWKYVNQRHDIHNPISLYACCRLYNSFPICEITKLGSFHPRFFSNDHPETSDIWKVPDWGKLLNNVKVSCRIQLSFYIFSLLIAYSMITFIYLYAAFPSWLWRKLLKRTSYLNIILTH